MIHTHHNFLAKNREQGAILLSTIIVIFVITMLAGSYLMLSSSEHRLSTRTFNRSASFALAEGGVDYAIHALDTNSFDDWTADGDHWTRELSNFTINSGSTGSIQIRIEDASSVAPSIYSVGTVSSGADSSVSREVKVVLGEISSGGTLGKSLLYAKFLDSAGNNVVAYMYNSDNGEPGVAYYDEDGNSLTNYDDGFRFVVDTMVASLGNLDVFGWVVTSPGGSVTFNSQGGTFTFNSGYDLDNGIPQDDRVTDDFYGSFEPQTMPTGLSYVSNPTLSFVEVGKGKNKTDVATWDGSKNYKYTGSGEVLALDNKETLNITGDVVLVVDGKGTIDIRGKLNIAEGASLKIYTNGDFLVTGDVNNSNTAKNLQIYGTNTTENEQLFKLHGNGRMTSFLYAPNSRAELKGGGGDGEFEGALVLNQIKMAGNYTFLGDEALGGIPGLTNAGGGYVVSEWVELDDRKVETAKYLLD